MPAARDEQEPRAHNGKQGNRKRTDAPKRKFAPYATTIDDGIGIERHGFRSFSRVPTLTVCSQSFSGHPADSVI